MPKVNFSDVLRAVRSRRSAGSDVDQNKAPRSTGSRVNIYWLANSPAIRELVGEYGNQATFAFGLIATETSSFIITAFKGVAVAVREEINSSISLVAQQVGSNFTTIDAGSIESGLHSEMSIVKCAVTNLGIQKNNLRYRLQIACVGKKVCLDCAGWLNQHGIGHCSVLPSDNPEIGGVIEFAAGSTSKMGGGLWANPLTGAIYSGGKDVTGYSKTSADGSYRSLFQ